MKCFVLLATGRRNLLIFNRASAEEIQDHQCDILNQQIHQMTILRGWNTVLEPDKTLVALSAKSGDGAGVTGLGWICGVAVIFPDAAI